MLLGQHPPNHTCALLPHAFSAALSAHLPTRLPAAEADSEPEQAVAVKQQLTQALLRQEAAARLAAQASGSGIIQRGRDKALRQIRKKRQKQGRAAAAPAKAAAGSGGGRQQSKLKLSVVQPALSSAPAALQQRA
jgi:hypothetical protein